jgi:hypothetical protein
MIQNEVRVVTYPEYGSSLGERLFPRQPTDGFFEDELRSQFAEFLASCIQPSASANVQQLLDRVRSFVPRALQDCSLQFRAAIDGRWRKNQWLITQALIRASEAGIEIVTADRASQ